MLLTALRAFAAISGVVCDVTDTHICNPAWPPHARFHGYLSIARTVLIMLAIVALASEPVSAGARWDWGLLALLLLGWIAIWSLGPLAVPGPGDRAAYIFAGVLAPVSLIGFWLVRPGARG